MRGSVTVGNWGSFLTFIDSGNQRLGFIISFELREIEEEKTLFK